jgi:hypothetical protein
MEERATQSSQEGFLKDINLPLLSSMNNLLNTKIKGCTFVDFMEILILSYYAF